MRINIKRAEALNKAIKAAEGKSRARTITTKDVVVELSKIEERLGITKKALDGTKVCLDINAQHFANA